MILRFVLIALLASSALAQAGPGDVPRAPRAPRAPSVRVHVSDLEDEESTSTDTTLSVPTGSRLVLENFRGDIAVSGWNQNKIRIQAEHAPRTRVRVDVRPASVTLSSVRRIHLPVLGNRRTSRVEEIEMPGDVEYRLTVPRGMSLGLSGVESDISVEGVEGDVSAEAVNGSVKVRGGRGRIRVSSINGGVEVSGASGTIEASSVNDEVLLRDVEGRLQVESVSGDVEMSGIASKMVEASTVSGDLHYSGHLSPGGTYRFESHSGDLTVALPERPDVTVTVDTYSGEFASSFPVEVSSLRRGKQFDFVLGDGRADLMMKSFSGTLLLTRAGVPAKRVRVIGTPKSR